MSYWLSFCDPKRPEGTRFLGACIVPGRDLREAARWAWVLNCNPGGEVLGLEVPPTIDPSIPAEWRNRLLSREEVDRLDAWCKARGLAVS